MVVVFGHSLLRVFVCRTRLLWIASLGFCLGYSLLKIFVLGQRFLLYSLLKVFVLGQRFLLDSICGVFVSCKGLG